MNYEFLRPGSAKYFLSGSLSFRCCILDRHAHLVQGIPQPVWHSPVLSYVHPGGNFYLPGRRKPHRRTDGRQASGSGDYLYCFTGNSWFICTFTPAGIQLAFVDLRIRLSVTFIRHHLAWDLYGSFYLFFSFLYPSPVLAQ